LGVASCCSAAATLGRISCSIATAAAASEDVVCGRNRSRCSAAAEGGGGVNGCNHTRPVP
jgi:hypothetical protein